ncbi:MAG: Cof-type HAD-IIB family hydrolase [Lentilactobacillus hilgardii]|uniref:Cof-type HAD-IIB family hydrolase n=1 Tax=Lentilactobacillus hilgardii TaxID=1588 RepID=UPI001CC20CDB|nr:Cof-type HAD-IIB family hydrolase [Lentilactobacillus hilgardii]MCI1922944.1 Cof-type HAD-IIB family hydrolase [Lentilactobacillus buchneri]MBZ2201306.1 HAD family hydrolase [Lentilactobacillus hilgardii]MBZ2202823.1 HAD family hydrolase [Lentilactobacillus hilgardii]MCI1950152.1 Cof-type HAD-IIB family hydrolase [Lentilactobacillus buchneri]MCI2019330.1 Cof-type HAD-IIB family hydrolase [Lentilactobacillus buchneri]
MIIISKKMIALDLDGTTLNDDAQLSSRTRSVINQAVKEGCVVSIVTGRPNRLSESFYDDLHLNTPMINFNGNLGILPHKNWEREYQYTIDKEIVMELLSNSRKLGLNLIAVEGRDLFLANRGISSGFGFFPSTLQSNQILNQKSLKDNPISITVQVEQPGQKQALMDYVLHHFGDQVEVSPWGGPHPIVEIATKGIHKSTGLKFLADYYGILQKDIIAFGDEANDATMMKYAGTGVAMKNAIDSIKKSADEVTQYTNDQDGVARYLEDYLNLAVG